MNVVCAYRYVTILCTIVHPFSYAYMHTSRLPQDLKPSNVLITSEGQPVLTDFEISKIVLSDMGKDDYTITDNQNALVGTRQFWPPEVVEHHRYKYNHVKDGMYVRSSDGIKIDTLLKYDKCFYSLAYKARDCWALGKYVHLYVYVIIVVCIYTCIL